MPAWRYWRGAQGTFRTISLKTHKGGDLALWLPLMAQVHPGLLLHTGEYDPGMPLTFCRRQWVLFAGTMQRSADPLMQHRAILLAQAYMEEIQRKPFSDDTPTGGLPASTGAGACSTGPEPGETRDTFDDVDDYDALDDRPPRTQTGGLLSGYADYRVQARVICSGLALGLGSDHDAKLIALTITTPVGDQQRFALYKGNY